MSPPFFEKVLILISQLGRLLVVYNNIVRILRILFPVGNGEERIGVHPLQLRVSLKSPLCIVPLIREGKEQPAGKEQSDAKQCNEQKALHRLQPFLNKVEIVDRIRKGVGEPYAPGGSVRGRWSMTIWGSAKVVAVIAKSITAETIKLTIRFIIYTSICYKY